MAIAAAVFAMLHSALAGARAKATAVALFGERAANGWYRPAYLAVSFLLVALLVWYVRRQPGRDVYHARGALGGLLRVGQLAALGLVAWTVIDAGPDFLTGWHGATAWWHGAAQVPPMPDGQGPAPADHGTMLAIGPFAYTRHPLNWLILPLLWLNPRLTTRLLAFNLVATAYVVVGSVHLESHLLDAYGAAYGWYQERVPFFVRVP